MREELAGYKLQGSGFKASTRSEGYLGKRKLCAEFYVQGSMLMTEAPFAFRRRIPPRLSPRDEACEQQVCRSR